MTVWSLKSSYGLVEIDENETIESFAEKPTLDKWINIGYFYVDNNYRKMIFLIMIVLSLFCYNQQKTKQLLVKLIAI